MPSFMNVPLAGAGHEELGDVHLHVGDRAGELVPGGGGAQEAGHRVHCLHCSLGHRQPGGVGKGPFTNDVATLNNQW